MLLAFHLIALPCAAQVVTDGSLGPNVSLIGPNYFVDSTLGQTRGANLFHSFSSFNISNGQSVAFNALPHVRNIIARMTGPSASVIDGSVGAPANLFLLNPRGFVLGANASFDTSSLYVSTADYLRFADGTRFSSTLGPSSVLSTDSPAAFGFFDDSSGSIAITGTRLSGATQQTLALIAGDISLTDVSIAVSYGQLHFAAVNAAGEARIAGTAIDTSAFAAMGSIGLDNTRINADEQPGTSIYIRAGQFVMENGSLLAASTTQAFERAAIDIHAGHVRVEASAIASTATGTGEGVDISIDAEDVAIGNGAAVLATNTGSNVGGDVFVSAQSVSITSGGLLGTGSTGGSGGAGNVFVDADRIDVSDGGLSSVTAGAADAGDISLRAQDLALGAGGLITSGTTAGGGGGNIAIETDSLTLEGNATAPAAISATTNALLGPGDAGSIRIDAETLQIRHGSITTSTAGPGNGGRIDIDAGHLSMTAGGVIATDTGIVGPSGSATTYGRGGAIEIDSNIVQMNDGARISADTLANGAGGSVHIDAGQVIIDGSATILSAVSGSALNTNATGAGGNLSIQAGNFELRNAAALSTSSFGVGSAGRITVTGDSAFIMDGAAITASSFGQALTAGSANDIHLDVGTLAVARGAQISNATHGAGAAGRLLIDADFVHISDGALLQVSSLSPAPVAGRVGDLFIAADQVVIDGGTIQAHSSGGALPGTIAISSGTLWLDNGATITAVGAGNGNAGNIGLYAAEALFARGFAQITTEAHAASGGNIALFTDGWLTLEDVLVSTSVLGGEADGGNVQLRSELSLLERSTIIARAVAGNGGRIDVVAPYVFRSADAVLDASSVLGIGGEVGIFGFEVDLNADIAPLPSDFLSAHRWLPQACARRLSAGASQLVVAGRDGAYRSPWDLAASPLEFDIGEPITQLDWPAPSYFAWTAAPCE